MDKEQTGKKRCIEMYENRMERWIDSYKEDFDGYPSNKKRLEIVLEIVRRKRPLNILYVGCGPCIPLIRIMQEVDSNVQGIDFSEKMISRGKELLNKHGLDPELIQVGDLEVMDTLPDEKFDFAIAMGVFEHFSDESTAFTNLNRKLSIGSTVTLGFRNAIFATFSFNHYSYDFFMNNLLDGIDFSVSLKKEANNFFQKKCGIPERGEFTPRLSMEKNGIIRKFHNPLTIHEMLEKFGFRLENNYFYHFHVLPPVFRKVNVQEYDRLSLSMENPLDWKGYLMASAFVSEAKKVRNI